MVIDEESSEGEEGGGGREGEMEMHPSASEGEDMEAPRSPPFASAGEREREEEEQQAQIAVSGGEDGKAKDSIDRVSDVTSGDLFHGEEEEGQEADNEDMAVSMRWRSLA